MANRTLARFDLPVVRADGHAAGEPADERGDEKVAPLSPVGLVEDPVAFYATLEDRLATAELVDTDRRSPVSPATRLVDTCRHLG